MHKIKSTFTISDFIIDELESVSKELGEKKSYIVEKALNMYFDYLDEKVADKRLCDLKEGKSTTVPAEQVFRELGL